MQRSKLPKHTTHELKAAKYLSPGMVICSDVSKTLPRFHRHGANLTSRPPLAEGAVEWVAYQSVRERETMVADTAYEYYSPDITSGTKSQCRSRFGVAMTTHILGSQARP